MIEYAVALSFFALLIWHEYSWVVKRRRWKQSKGKIVSHTRFKEGRYGDDSPIVEWSFNGERKRFTSNYSRSFDRVGAEINILHSLDGAKAEVDTVWTRLFFSIVGVLGVLFSVLAKYA